MEVPGHTINLTRLRKKPASEHIDSKAFEWAHLVIQKDAMGNPS